MATVLNQPTKLLTGKVTIQKFQLLNVSLVEWYLDMEKANKQSPGSDPPWQQMYNSVLDEYNMRYVEPEDWYQLAKRFLKGDGAVQKYVG